MSRKTVSAVIGSLLVVVFALGALQGCGSDGTGGTGTGGTNGTTGGTSGTGTGGATGAAGAKGSGGTTSTGGVSGAAGGSGTTAACSVCDKAQTCCIQAAPTLNQPTSDCTFSTAACNAMSGSAQSTYATGCQTILTDGALLSISACK
jgi:hypothetical protein